MIFFGSYLTQAGKTTLVKLVTRLYDPTEGEILLNGTDIRRFALYKPHSVDDTNLSGRM